MSRRSLITAALLTWAMVNDLPTAKAQDPKSPKVAWRFVDQPTKLDLSNPLWADGAVVFGNQDGVLRALKAEDGAELWKHEHGRRIHNRPCADQDHVYFSSDQGLFALSRKDGKAKWHYYILDGGGPPVVLAAKDTVFVGGNNGFVYAVSAKTGEFRWKTSILSDAPPDPPGFPGQQARIGEAWARPTGASCDGERFYQSVFDQSRLVAFDVATGKTIWSYQARGWILGTPSLSAAHVFVGSQDKFLHCLDKRTGKLVWKFPTKSRIESGAAVDAKSVFFGSCDGGVYCVNVADGRQRWRFDTDADPTGHRSIYSTPVLTDNALYFAAGEGQVYALEKETGNLKWKMRVGDKSQTYCSPASDGQRLFVVTRPASDEEGQTSLVAIDTKLSR